MTKQLTLNLETQAQPKPALARVLFYDYKRDGDIKPGETLVLYVDGTSKKVKL